VSVALLSISELIFVFEDFWAAKTTSDEIVTLPLPVSGFARHKASFPEAQCAAHGPGTAARTIEFFATGPKIDTQNTR